MVHHELRRRITFHDAEALHFYYFICYVFKKRMPVWSVSMSCVLCLNPLILPQNPTACMSLRGADETHDIETT